MGLSKAIQSIRRGELHYLFGRFYTFGRFYSQIRRRVESPRVSVVQTSDRIQYEDFSEVDIREAVTLLHTDAVYLGLKLPTRIVAEICEFARRDKYGSTMSNQTSTAASQAKFDYKTAVGLPPTSNSAGMDAITSSENQHAGVITTWPAPTDIVDVINPLDCRAVESVANWPTLSDVARKYLGYTPTTRDVRLRWTIAKRLDHGQCEALNATVPMHFDFNAFRTMYANFYLTDTDRWSGAHVFVKGSHRRKPLRWTFGCSVRRESEIRKIYSPTDVIVVEGVAGSGFFEDPLCYHKPTAPADHDRLFLQVRFY